MNESEEQAATCSNSFGSSEIQEERVKLEVLGWQNPLGGRHRLVSLGKHSAYVCTLKSLRQNRIKKKSYCWSQIF